MLDDDHEVVRVQFVPHIPTYEVFLDPGHHLLNVDIEEGWAYRRALVHSVLEEHSSLILTYEIEVVV